MREIKFKLWDTRNKCWFKTNGDVRWANLTPSGEIVTGWGSEVDYGTEPSDFIICMYTGLKDKNGKEIFEGDIVKAWVCLGPAGEMQVIHSVTIGKFGPNFQEWTFKGKNHLPEVIGNKYENPELLKQEEKMKKLKSFWLIRPQIRFGRTKYCYQISQKKMSGSDNGAPLCHVADFERIAGIKLRRGQQVKVRLVVEKDTSRANQGKGE